MEGVGWVAERPHHGELGLGPGRKWSQSSNCLSDLPPPTDGGAGLQMLEAISLHSFCTVENKSLNLYILSGHNINKVHFIKLRQPIQQRESCHFLFVLMGRLHLGSWPGGELGEGSHPPWWLPSVLTTHRPVEAVGNHSCFMQAFSPAHASTEWQT